MLDVLIIGETLGVKTESASRYQPLVQLSLEYALGFGYNQRLHLAHRTLDIQSVKLFILLLLPLLHALLAEQLHAIITANGS